MTTVLILAMLLALCAPTFSAIVLNETFEGASWQSNWAGTAKPTSGTGPDATHGQSCTVANYNVRVTRDFAGATAGKPVVMRWWLYDVTASGAGYLDIRSTGAQQRYGISQVDGNTFGYYQYRFGDNSVDNPQAGDIGMTRVYGQWHRFEIRYNGDKTVEYYINGALKQTKSAPTAPTYLLGRLALGPGGTAGTRTPCYIDDVVVITDPIKVTVAAGTGGTVATSGTVTNAGGTSAFQLLNGYYDSSEAISVSATPNARYNFGSWTATSGTFDNPNSPNAVYTPAAGNTTATVTANFVPNGYLVTLLASPTGAATFTGADVYTPGTSATVTATTVPGYTFSHWTSATPGTPPDSTDNPYTFQVNADTTLTAQFTTNNYGLNLSTNDEECTISSVPDSGSSVPFDSSVTVRVDTTGNCKTFLGWLDIDSTDNHILSTRPTYTFKMPARDLNMMAIFIAQRGAWWFDGFESYNNGDLDKNGVDGTPAGVNYPNKGDTNPWFGNGPPNMYIDGGTDTAPRTGKKLARPKSGYAGCEDTYNLASRNGGGYAFSGDIFLDWWFYDPATSNPAGFQDGVELGSYSGIPGDKDFTPTLEGGGTAQQRTYLGAAPTAAQDASKYDPTKYQVRIMNAVTPEAYNANGWCNIPGVARAKGWHHARLVVGPMNASMFSEVSVYLDDMTTRRMSAFSTTPIPTAYNCVKMWGNTNTAWGASFDDMTFGTVPGVAGTSFSMRDYINVPSVVATFEGVGAVPYYDYSIDGGPVTRITTNTCTIPTASLAHGAHTISVMTTDLCGNVSGPSVTPFTIDRSSFRNYAAIGFYPFGTGAPDPARFSTDFFAPDGTEASMCASLGKTYAGKSWINYSSPTPIVDFDLVWGGRKTYGVSYLFTYIINNGPEITNVAYLTGGSDDGLKAWINGNVVLANDVYRGIAIDSDLSSPFTLKQGVNTLLIKETQGAVSEYAQARLCAADRSEPAWLKDLTYVVDDSVAPTGTVRINDGSGTTTNGNVTLNLTMADALSGPGYMSFSNDNTTWSPKEPFAATKAWSLTSGTGAKTVYVTLFDRANNALPLTANVTVTLPNYALTLTSKPAGGAATLSGAGTYQASTAVSVSTTANTHYTFKKWTSDVDGNNTISTSASFTYTMPSQDQTIYAWFDADKYALNVSADIAGGGTASSVPATGDVGYATSVTATATPDPCMRFDKWVNETGATVSTQKVYTFNMPANPVTLIAKFATPPQVWRDGFETYNPDVQLDGQGWWLPDYSNSNGAPDLKVVASAGTITPHGGGKMAVAWAVADHDGNMINLAYHLGGGAPLPGGFAIDWWFYDPLGATGGAGYWDYAAVDQITGVSNTADPTSNAGLVAVQRLSLGGTANQSAGFDATKYQARVVGSGGYDGNGWFNLPTGRTVGWHHAKIAVGNKLANNTNDIEFYIDDMVNPASVKNSTTTGSYNVLQMTAGYGTTNGAFDDFAYDPTPHISSVSLSPSDHVTGNTTQATFKSLGAMASYKVAIDSASGPFVTTTSNPYTLDVSGVTNATHTVYVIGVDQYGCETGPVSATFVKEANPAVPVAAISGLWAKGNDSTQYVLTGKTVTGVVGGAFWIEETDRTAAIKVIGTAIQGRKVDVTGTLSVIGGQRVLTAVSVTDAGAGDVINPLGVVERAAGGKNTTGTPSIDNGVGLYNIGLLVRIAGTAGYADNSVPTARFFYLDDGSGLATGAATGIKVLCDGVIPPSSGTVIVTGLVGVEGGKPVLIIRGTGDIRIP